MNPIELKQFIKNNPKLVSMKESKRYPGLFVLKYSRKVFYDNLWNNFLVECRGTVVDKDMNVIVRPFTKVFNYGENGTTINKYEPVVAVRKVNGFMFTLTYHSNYGVIAGTTGSLDSNFVDMGKMLVTNKVYKTVKENEGVTFIFEVCHPDDPHIIKENYGLYLIGARKTDWNGHQFGQIKLDDYAEQMNVYRPEWDIFAEFSDLLEEAKTVKHEGFMVHGANITLKLKSPYYLITKFMARKGPEKLLNYINSPNLLKEITDEEYYPLIDYVVENKEKFVSMDEQNRISFIEKYFE